ncbi:Uncharacterized protein APZ42_012074 [Daphnia magna]|uniref:Uncharacterized protein n=1 Tax=Daphnia magna TaxID=35525 RepID=A0A162S286_9CRUS|nr:Uncharacterized protein APZ42_012074 [Daphnia magna]
MFIHRQSERSLLQQDARGNIVEGLNRSTLLPYPGVTFKTISCETRFSYRYFLLFT